MFTSFRSGKVEPVFPIESSDGDFPKISGAALAAAYYEQRHGGDLYDSLRVSPERVIFGLLDVAGRREENQVLLSSTKTLFRTLGAELFSKPDINESEAMTELCLRLNQHVLKTAGGVHPCPAFIGCYHEGFGTLCYTNAGHTPGLLSDSSSVASLEATGLPLGLFSHATSEALIAGMAPGAALLLVSRGVVEARCRHKKAHEQEFGLESVKDFLRSQPDATAQSLCTSILKTASDFTCESSNQDDMTALALVRAAR